MTLPYIPLKSAGCLLTHPMLVLKKKLSGCDQMCLAATLIFWVLNHFSNYSIKITTAEQ